MNMKGVRDFEGDPSSCCTEQEIRLVDDPLRMLGAEQRTVLPARELFEIRKNGEAKTNPCSLNSSLVDLSQTLGGRWRAKSDDGSSPFVLPSHLCLESSPSGVCASRNNKRDSCVDVCDGNVVGAECLPRTSVSSKFNEGSSSSRRGSFRFYVPKLSEVIIWLCVLCLTFPASTKGAPLARSFSHPRFKTISGKMPLRETPLWLNPCGDVSSDAVSSQLPQFQGVSNLDLFRQILIQAKNALSQAEGRKKEFVTEYFQVDYDRHTDEWKSSSSSYDWLPNFNKDIGEKATEEHLESLTADVDGTLSRVFTDLQKIAVGLEQLAADHKSMNTQFQSMFRTAEYDLRALLCEIQVALEEHKVNRPHNITRDIMSDEIRHIVGNRDRSIRDWIIYRDYMNSLEYIIDLMEFYVKKINAGKMAD